MENQTRASNAQQKNRVIIVKRFLNCLKASQFELTKPSIIDDQLAYKINSGHNQTKNTV